MPWASSHRSESTASGVAKAVSGAVCYDSEHSMMNRAVVHAAQREEVLGVVTAACRARHDMVKVEEGRVLATWNPAPVPIAKQDSAARCRWDLLLGARWALGPRGSAGERLVCARRAKPLSLLPKYSAHRRAARVLIAGTEPE